MKYTGLFSNGLKEALSYRSDSFFVLMLKPISLLFITALFTTLYSGSDSIGGLTMTQAITYMMFGSIFWELSNASAGFTLGSDIKENRLSVKLIKPIDYGRQALFTNLGELMYRLFFEALPTMIIAIIFFNLKMPSLIIFILSIISLLLGFIINEFFCLSWGLFYFLLIDFRPLDWLKNMMVNFLSGRLLPLQFMPAVLVSLSNYLPFQLINHVPASIFINYYPIESALLMILTQLVWAIMLFALYRIGWHYGLKSFVGVGI